MYFVCLLNIFFHNLFSYLNLRQGPNRQSSHFPAVLTLALSKNAHNTHFKFLCFSTHSVLNFDIFNHLTVTKGKNNSDLNTEDFHVIGLIIIIIIKKLWKFGGHSVLLCSVPFCSFQSHLTEYQMKYTRMINNTCKLLWWTALFLL